MLNIGVLISGGGSNLQAIIDDCESKKINGNIKVVISNREDAFGLEDVYKRQLRGRVKFPTGGKARELFL